MLRSPPTRRADGGPDTRRIEQGGHLGDEQCRIGERLHDVAIRARRDRRQHRVLKGGVFLIARLGTAIADWNVYVTHIGPRPRRTLCRGRDAAAPCNKEVTEMKAPHPCASLHFIGLNSADPNEVETLHTGRLCPSKNVENYGNTLILRCSGSEHAARHALHPTSSGIARFCARSTRAAAAVVGPSPVLATTRHLRESAIGTSPSRQSWRARSSSWRICRGWAGEVKNV